MRSVSGADYRPRHRLVKLPSPPLPLCVRPYNAAIVSDLHARRRWLLPPLAVDPRVLSSGGVDPLVAEILARRGVSDVGAARDFLARAGGEEDPFRLADMDRAVERLCRAISSREPIVIYGDFDADGITAAAVLEETLGSLGASVSSFIPHRQEHGYGLHAHVLEDLAAKGARLLVTVDCGVRDVQPLEAAVRAGLDVIVTDHHLLPDRMPDVLAVVNPHRPDSDYRFTELSGAGVAYKLAQALLRTCAGGARREAAEDALLDLVALGTVGDVVPLVGENRHLVYRGLAWVRRGERPGLAALAAVANLDLERIESRTLAYALVPRLNAAGRMADATVALELLTTRNPSRAQELATQLNELNEQRRAATARAVGAAEAQIQTEELDSLLWYADEQLPLGVLGLVAGRLAERHYRPAAVVRIDGPRARGSARSIPELDITALLESTADLLLRFGGHSQAAGFAVAARDIPILAERLKEAARRQLAGRDLRPALIVDARLPLSRADVATFQALEELSPFGESNPRPRFWLHRVTVSQVRLMSGDHLRFRVADPARPEGVAAVAFGQGERLSALRATQSVDLVAHLQRDEWAGHSQA